MILADSPRTSDKFLCPLHIIREWQARRSTVGGFAMVAPESLGSTRFKFWNWADRARPHNSSTVGIVCMKLGKEAGMQDRAEHAQASTSGSHTKAQRTWIMLRGILALVSGVIVLSGCDIGSGGVIFSDNRPEDIIPMRAVSAEQAWINAPEAQMVLQRELPRTTEQQISLRNRTLVPGDNLMALRTRSGLRARGPLRFEELVRWVGEIPAPFANVTPGEMISDSDELGSYLWTEEPFGNDTLCVLGIRRVDSSMRQIPSRDDVMDVMLRNCVIGTAEDALQPLLAGSITSPALAQVGSGESRLISPLAGPTIP